MENDTLDSDGPLDPNGEGYHGRSEGVESYSPTLIPTGEEPVSWKQKVGRFVHPLLVVMVYGCPGAVSQSAHRCPGNPCRSVPAPQSSHCQSSSSLGMSFVNASLTMD